MVVYFYTCVYVTVRFKFRFALIRVASFKEGRTAFKPINRLIKNLHAKQTRFNAGVTEQIIPQSFYHCIRIPE